MANPLFLQQSTVQFVSKYYIFLLNRPIVKDKAMVHDSYFCQKYSPTQPFPTQRKEGIGNFVGSVIQLNNTIGFYKEYECPRKCRPINHMDWLYC